jgi:uncharacterized RDD family membrane protein YckC/ribosomal protein L40E
MEQKPIGDFSGDIQKQPEYILTPPVNQEPVPAGPEKICSNCGAANAPDAVFCHKCGIKLPENIAADKKTCAGCGAQNALTAEYCFKCGLKLPEPIGTSQPRRYGGFWVRLLAWLIDGLLLGVLVGIVMTPFSAGFLQKFMDYFNSSSYSAGTLPPWYWQYLFVYSSITFVAGVLYQTIAIGKWGKTIGQAALGLKVVKPDGSKVSFARAFGRALAQVLTGTIFALAYIVIAFTPQKRGLHDYIADTIVIKTR